MIDSDTEFMDRAAIENLECDTSEAVIREQDDSNGSNFVPTTKPIEAVVKIVKPDFEFEDDGDDVTCETIGLEGLLTLIKIESERYAAQNGRMFQTVNNELTAFLGINIIPSPSHENYCSVEEFDNPLIQKAMRRARF